MKSVITEHCKIMDQIMDREIARIICSEDDWYHRWIKDIKVRKQQG